MPAVGVSKALRDVVVLGKEDGGVRTVHRVLKEQPVHRLQKTLRLFARQGKLAAKVGLQVGHQQCGSDSLARDIPDEQPDLLLPESEEIVVVAPDMAGLDAGARIIQRPERGKGLRKQPGLHLFCDFQFLGQAPFRFEPLSIRAALRLNLPAHLIGAKQVEGILIRIAKHRHRAAPQLRLRRMKKTHSTAQPKIVGRKDVFGDEKQSALAAR